MTQELTTSQEQKINSSAQTCMRRITTRTWYAKNNERKDKTPQENQ